MAEVINSMSDMKLTTEEEEVIAVSDKGRKEEVIAVALKAWWENFWLANRSTKERFNTLRRKRGGWKRVPRLSRWVPTFFSLSSRQNLTWKEFLEEDLGHLTIKH